MAGSVHREGELYKVYNIDSHRFEIRYGYYEEKERGRLEPLPVYPDLHSKPHFTSDGQPIVTVIQVPCRHYKPGNPHKPEQWCGDCRHYDGGLEEIGLCRCRQRRRDTHGLSPGATPFCKPETLP